MRIVFHAPLKAPDHPLPSGDRTMARALVEIMRRAGHAVLEPTRLRSFMAAPDAARQAALERDARAERDRIAHDWQAGAAPDLWFTYHNHYKAPDLIGPPLARAFAVPYVLAEASHAPKRAAAWGAWHRAAEAATRAADLHVCFTARDRDGIAPLVRPGGAVLHLPPFVDVAGHLARPGRTDARPMRLVTVAMMRPGDKRDSYRFLAEALGQIVDLAWHLDVVGDGPARGEVTAAFAPLPADRVTWHGECGRGETWRHLAAADLLVWPGFGEAFGLAYLEAQAAGVPPVALDTAGVGSVIRHCETGVLVADPTAAAYAGALRRLIGAPAEVARMGAAAQAFVLAERSLDAAAAVLDKSLRDVVERKALRHG